MSKAEQFQRAIFQHKDQIPRIIGQAGYNLTFGEMRRFLDWLVATPFKHFFQPAILHKAVSDIKYIQRKIPQLSLEGEFERLAHVLIQNSQMVSRVVAAEEGVHRALLLGDYTKSEAQLKQLAEDVGASIWSMEIEFFVAFQREGVPGVRALRRNLRQQNGDLIVDLFAYFCELANQPEMSARGLELEKQRVLRMFNKAGNHLTPFIDLSLGSSRDTTSDELVEALYFTWWLPLVDQYRIFLRMASILSLRPEHATPRFLACLLAVREKICIPRLDAICGLLGRNFDLLVSSAKPAVIELLDFYSLGDINRSAEVAVALLNKDPSCTPAIEVLSKLSPEMTERALTEWPKTALLTRIVGGLNRYYFGTEPLDQRIDAVTKLVWICGLTGLAEFVAGFIVPKQNRFKLSAEGIRFPVSDVTPRFVVSLGESASRKDFLDRLVSRVGDGVTVSVMRFVYTAKETTGAVLPENLPPLRKTFFEACRLEELGNHLGATEVLERLVSLLEASPQKSKRDLAEAYRGLFRATLKAGLSARTLDISLQSFRSDPEIFHQLGVENFLERTSIAATLDIEANIRRPIAAALCYQDGRKVHQFCDAFLEAHRCKVPTDLKPLAISFGQADLLWFLEKACRLEVLSNNFWLDGTEDLENQRIEICRWICELSLELTPTARAEITTIARNSAIRKGVQRIEQSKIHVNTDGIRRKSERVLQESYARIQSLRALPAGELEKLIDPAGLYQRIIDQAQKSETSTILLVTDPAFPVFEEIFLNIRDEFAGSGEYGLDSYLGVRIRHGTLLGQLRRAFAQLKLVTAKNDAGAYLENDTWKQKTSTSTVTWAKISAGLEALSQFVDQRTMHLKSQWIKVRTDEAQKEGLFDFRFSRTDLLIIYRSRINSEQSVEDFVAVIFDVLWQRTFASLEAVRQKITHEEQPEFIRQLTRCENRIRDISESDQVDLSELSQALALCRTNVQADFEKVAAWFSVPQGREDPDATLEEAAQIAAEIVHRLYPTAIFRPALEVPPGLRIRGRVFVPLVDILQILLDNVVRHSGFGGMDLRASLSVSLTSNALRIVCCNNVREPERLQLKLKQLPKPAEWVDISLEGSTREDNSGLYKLAKIMKSDLTARHFTITPELDVVGTPTFTITIECDSSDFVV